MTKKSTREKVRSYRERMRARGMPGASMGT